MALLTCVGYLETTGGPACIGALSAARNWSGVDGDYWRLAEDPRCLSKRVFSFEGFLIFVPRFGNVLVFTGADVFAIAEIVGGEWMPEETSTILGMRIETASIDPRSRQDALDRFGGLIAVFDSTLEGKSIGGEVGVRAAEPFEGQTPNTAVIEIPLGSWELCEARHQSGYFNIDILLFNLMR